VFSPVVNAVGLSVHLCLGLQSVYLFERSSSSLTHDYVGRPGRKTLFFCDNIALLTEVYTRFCSLLDDGVGVSVSGERVMLFSGTLAGSEKEKFLAEFTPRFALKTVVFCTSAFGMGMGM